jgi:hypothetical protein
MNEKVSVMTEPTSPQTDPCAAFTVPDTGGLFALGEVVMDDCDEDSRLLIHVPTNYGVTYFTHDDVGVAVAQQLYAIDPSMWDSSSPDEVVARVPKRMQKWIRYMKAYDRSDAPGQGLPIEMIRTLYEFVKDQENREQRS